MRLLFALALLVLALVLVAFLLLVRPAWSATRCTTYEEQTLDRLQTLCDDGTLAVSTYNKTLECWDTTVTPLPGEGLHRAVEPEDPLVGGSVSVRQPREGHECNSISFLPCRPLETCYVS